jgi:Xaa-Pro aminopeptidase
MSARVAQVLDELEERGLDALLVTGLVNVRWLTGFTGSSGLAVLGSDVCRFASSWWGPAG